MKKNVKHKVNSEIAVTHLVTRKRQILMAAMGVTVGIGIFIFMTCADANPDAQDNTFTFRHRIGGNTQTV